MITSVSTSQLVHSVRRALLDQIAPALSDPTLSTTIQMMASVLLAAAKRADGEVGWMRDEADDIARETAALVIALPSDDGLVNAAAAYSAHRTASPDVESARADYERASELLSCAIEAAFRADDLECVARLRGLLDRRLARETQIMGEPFTAPGRA